MGTEQTQQDSAPHNAPHSAPTLIGSVQRALRLVEAMYAEDGATAKRLARITGIPSRPSTTCCAPSPTRGTSAARAGPSGWPTACPCRWPPDRR